LKFAEKPYWLLWWGCPWAGTIYTPFTPFLLGTHYIPLLLGTETLLAERNSHFPTYIHPLLSLESVYVQGNMKEKRICHFQELGNSHNLYFAANHRLQFLHSPNLTILSSVTSLFSSLLTCNTLLSHAKDSQTLTSPSTPFYINL